MSSCVKELVGTAEQAQRKPEIPASRDPRHLQLAPPFLQLARPLLSSKCDKFLHALFVYFRMV